MRIIAGAERRAVAVLGETMQAQVVPAPLHVGGGEFHAQRLGENRKVLEVDLFLEILGTRRDEHALSAEDGGDEVGKCFPRAGARFREQHTVVGEHAGDRVGHFHLALARLEPLERPRDRSTRSECAGHVVSQAGLCRHGAHSGYSGNFLHRASTSA